MSMGGWGTPGIGAERTVAESELLWGSDQARNALLWLSGLVSGAARDAANTPTTVLRPGLILGQISSNKKLMEFTVAATDGTQNFFGVLDTELRAQDFDATNQDRVFRIMVARAPVKSRQLKILGSAFIGHASEYILRRQMVAAGFVFDDDPAGFLAGVNYRTAAKTADYTVLPTDNGTYFTTRGNGAAINFTLPTILRGLEYHFYNEAGQTMKLTSVVADTLVVFNDLAADTIDFETAGELIGSKFKIRANDDASKWLVEVNLGAETVTPTITT